MTRPGGASSDAPPSVAVRLSRKTVWEVEILTAEQGIMSVYVDADSGSVITTEEKMTGKTPTQEKKS